MTQEQASTVITDTILTSTQDEESKTPISRAVVIAIDQSEYSQKAFDWAVKNFLRKDDLVVLVNVRPSPTTPGPYGASYMDFTEIIDGQQRFISHTLLKEFATKLKSHDFACKAIAMQGDPREEIVRKVSELHASALIVGSRGLGILKRIFIGSVSDYCSHHCNCTVIVVKH
ncbi:adenine nucleotide alpha hydrolases-like protein [Gigaspora margarita]|uniref:Adenine nucleotide alpha hydrolases-like protein n=1 Tax=Gigaspora margarita TaxID=4874 RepID=A0A8H4EPS8_GIGMA|nr:adenine nucleotide alpha hydrolases-like protein [Gigaspora margarita]